MLERSLGHAHRLSCSVLEHDRIRRTPDFADPRCRDAGRACRRFECRRFRGRNADQHLVVVSSGQGYGTGPCVQRDGFPDRNPIFGSLFVKPQIIHHTASLVVRDNRDLTQIYNPSPAAARSTCDLYTA